MKSHVDNPHLQELLAKGFVELGREGDWVEIGDPKTMCLHRMPRGGICRLDKDHKSKRHATVVFSCELCGKTYSGHPHKQDRVIINGEVDDVFDFCFLCCKESGDA